MYVKVDENKNCLKMGTMYINNIHEYSRDFFNLIMWTNQDE